MKKPCNMDEFVDRAKLAVADTGALFGYVFEIASDNSSNFSRGRPLVGRITDAAELRLYFKPIGNRALQIRQLGSDEMIAVNGPTDDQGRTSRWFAAVLNQAACPVACVVLVYPFDNDDNARQIFTRMYELLGPSDDN